MNVSNKDMEQHALEDRRYGSMTALICEIIAAIMLFFGGSNEITWLSVIALVVFAFGIFMAFSDSFTGWMTVVEGALFLGLMLIFKSYLINSLTKNGSGISNTIGEWLNGNGATDFYYISRAFVVICVILAVYHLYTFLRTYTNDD